MNSGPEDPVKKDPEQGTSDLLTKMHEGLEKTTKKATGGSVIPPQKEVTPFSDRMKSAEAAQTEPAEAGK